MGDAAQGFSCRRKSISWGQSTLFKHNCRSGWEYGEEMREHLRKDKQLSLLGKEGGGMVYGQEVLHRPVC